ncbi:MAG: acyl carrier protein [Calditrichia bacterium]
MDIKTEVKNFLYEDQLKNEFDSLTDDDSLLEKGIIDSVKMLDLIGFLEEKFNLEIDDEDLYPENFDSLNAIADYIGRKS